MTQVLEIGDKLRTIIIASLFIALPLAGEAQHFIGIKEGVSKSSVQFKPEQQKDSALIQWLNIGLVYKYYNSPWVGLQTGLNYAERGFGRNDTLRKYKVIELPLLSQFHYETWHLRFMINAGVYASYVLSGEEICVVRKTTAKYEFTDRDRRLEYGLHAGAGIGIIFKPFELQFEGGYQFSFSYVMEPKYKNEPILYTHFSRWMLSVALLFQL